MNGYKRCPCKNPRQSTQMEIVNTTVCAIASEKINLCLVLNCVPFRTFDAVHVKLDDATCVIFHSGKINCLGAKSFDQSVSILKKLQIKLRDDLNCPHLAISHIRLTNIVAHYNLIPSPLDLEVLYNYWKNKGAKGQVLFEPELYPALKVALLKGTLLVYHSGKVLLTGVKDVNHLTDLQEEFNKSVNWLLGFHSVVMAAPRPKHQSKKLKPVDEMAKLLEEIESERDPSLPPSPSPLFPLTPVSSVVITKESTVAFTLCSECFMALRDKKKHWRKRKGRHLTNISMCNSCFKTNVKVFQNCNPKVLDHIDGPNGPCWQWMDL